MDNFADTKWIGKSKTFIGLAVAAVASFAPHIGLDFSEADGQSILEAYDQVVVALGLLIALWGRWTADTKVTALPKSE